MTSVYRLHDPVPDTVDDVFDQYAPLTRQLLYNRGITSGEAAEVFLNPDYERDLHDPFLLTDMDKGVERLLAAVKNKEHIIVYSDYDCDGIPGGVLMHDFFNAIEYEEFTNYIPHRHDEGYGFNADSVEVLKGKGASVILTIDCGIVDHEATKKAQDEGIDVIITDHHEPNGSLPSAYAVINPKRDDLYPFNGLCGTGVAYKLVLALLREGSKAGLFDLKEGWEKWWLDVVGIATIADMVPLTDENRTLAHYGLHVLRKSRRPGIQHLIRKSGGKQEFLTEDDIGFTIGPRINAASRMDTPEDAFHMLATKDEAEAGERVRHLEKLNNERKGVVAAMTKEAKKRLTQMNEVPAVLVLGNPEWRPSLVGLVANALVDEYKKPAYIWGRDGRGVIKGSCRGNGHTSTLTLMESTPDSFIEFGGHHQSGGFSVSEEKIHTLLEALNEAYASGENRNEDQTEIAIDADLRLDDLDEAFVRSLMRLAPFGEGNPKPLFRFQDVVPHDVQIFGKTKNHTKVLFDTKHGVREAISFFKTPESFSVEPEALKEMTLIAHIEDSFFMGRKQTRLRIIDSI